MLMNRLESIYLDIDYPIWKDQDAQEGGELG